MEPLFLLLNQNPTISQTKELVEGVMVELRNHELVLALFHKDGAAHVSKTLIAGQELLDLIAVTDKEQSDVVGASAATQAVIAAGLGYASFMGEQIRSIAPALPEAEGKALRAAYSINRYRVAVERVSDLQRILERFKAAHADHGATLLSWGLEQADLDRCDALLAGLPASREVEQKERNEAEAAVIKRDVAEAAFYDDANALLRRLLAMRSRYPDTAQAFASVLNKHRAALSDPAQG